MEIEDPDNNKWIRMEPIYRDAQSAGDGKRDYFTVENLVESGITRRFYNESLPECLDEIGAYIKEMR